MKQGLVAPSNTAGALSPPPWSHNLNIKESLRCVFLPLFLEVIERLRATGRETGCTLQNSAADIQQWRGGLLLGRRSTAWLRLSSVYLLAKGVILVHLVARLQPTGPLWQRSRRATNRRSAARKLSQNIIHSAGRHSDGKIKRAHFNEKRQQTEGQQRNAKNADAGSAPGALFVIILIRGFYYHAPLDTEGGRLFLNCKIPTKQNFSLLFVSICCAAAFSLMKAPCFHNLIKYAASVPLWLNQVMTRWFAGLISCLRHHTKVWVWGGRDNKFCIDFWNLTVFQWKMIKNVL